MSCFVSVDPDFPPVACPRLFVRYLFFCVCRTYSKCDLVSPSSTREVVKLVLSPTTRAQKLLFQICRAASMWELVSNGCQCSNQKGHVAQLQWFNEKGEIRCLISCVNLELTTECVRVEEVFTWLESLNVRDLVGTGIGQAYFSTFPTRRRHCAWLRFDPTWMEMEITGLFVDLTFRDRSLSAYPYLV